MSDSETDMLVVYVPVAAIRAALRFTRRGMSSDVLHCVRVHCDTDGGAIMVEATDSYRLIQLRVDPPRNNSQPKVDVLVDFGDGARLNGKIHGGCLHITGDHGYLSWALDKHGDGMRTYFRARDEKFPDFGKLLPSDDVVYDGAVGVAFGGRLITDIYKASLDIGAPYARMLGVPHSDKDTEYGPMAFGAVGNDISMRALIMPANYGSARRSYRRAYVGDQA